MTAPPQSESTLLPGGTRMPLIGFGTYKVDKAESVRYISCLQYPHCHTYGFSLPSYLLSLCWRPLHAARVIADCSCAYTKALCPGNCSYSVTAVSILVCSMHNKHKHRFRVVQQAWNSVFSLWRTAIAKVSISIHVQYHAVS